MLKQTSAEARTLVAVHSTGAFPGARPITGTEVATAAPAVAQNGQKWEAPSAAPRSAQK